MWPKTTTFSFTVVYMLKEKGFTHTGPCRDKNYFDVSQELHIIDLDVL
jgi:hypothetical protein